MFEEGDTVRLTEPAEVYLDGWATYPAQSMWRVVGMHKGNVVVTRFDARLTLPARLLRRV